ncbi:MAG: hypothetical protein AABY07_10930 [Nanoarchaeota archaeon]
MTGEYEEQLQELEEVDDVDIIDFLLERTTVLEEVVSQLVEAFSELNLNYQALFLIMRDSGKFSKDAFKRHRARLARELMAQEEEEEE